MRTLSRPRITQAEEKTREGLATLVQWVLPAIEIARKIQRRHGVLLFALSAIAIGSLVGFLAVSPFSSMDFSYPTFSAAASSGVAGTLPMVGLRIANNGLIHVEGARVTGISGSVMTVVSEWDEAQFRWGIQITDRTVFVLPDGERGNISDISTGDYVNVTGLLAEDSTQFLWIDAEVVRGVLLQSENEKETVTYLRETAPRGF